jgi:hypothetical protein
MLWSLLVCCLRLSDSPTNHGRITQLPLSLCTNNQIKSHSSFALTPKPHTASFCKNSNLLSPLNEIEIVVSVEKVKVTIDMMAFAEISEYNNLIY